VVIVNVLEKFVFVASIGLPPVNVAVAPAGNPEITLRVMVHVLLLPPIVTFTEYTALPPWTTVKLAGLSAMAVG
jgi:hypothetical protein